MVRLLFIVLAAAGIALSACSDAATLPSPGTRLLLENPDDPEDEAINLNLHLLARSLADVVREEEMLALVLAESERYGEVRLSEVASRNERFAELLDAALARHNPEGGGGALTLGDVARRMTYRGTLYPPSLYIPNLHVARADSSPIVAIGASATPESQIAGWDLHPGEPRSVLVGQEMASRPGGAVIIVTNGSSQAAAPLPDPSRYAAALSPAAGPAQQTSTSGQVFDWSQYQIKAGYHYEVPLQKADLSYLVTLFNSSWGTLFDAANQSVPGVFFGMIDRIRKSDSDNNTVFNVTQPFTGFFYTNALNNYPRMFVTVFEYDWWASKQLITCGPLQHKPRMKYAHEWYAATCNIQIPTAFPIVGSTYVLSSAKGSFTILRN